MVLLELVLGFGIGLSLGLLGGGRSLLTVPALVYLAGQTPRAAVTTSLAIVGANSMVGAMFHGSQGRLDWKVALVFGSAGMFVSYLAAGFSKHISPELLLVAFALLMIGIGSMLLLRRTNEEETERAARPLWLVVASGAGVGLLTGILGVGGGFLVVPALVMLVGLPTQTAIGASLIVIAMNSLAGFLGHLGTEVTDWIVTLVFTSAGLLGTFSGMKLSRRLSSAKLQKVFAVFVIALAGFLLVDNLPKLFRCKERVYVFTTVLCRGVRVCIISCRMRGKRVAVVVDPDREVQKYLDLAASRGLQITHIIETHLHADHVPGNTDLAAHKSRYLCA